MKISDTESLNRCRNAKKSNLWYFIAICRHFAFAANYRKGMKSRQNCHHQTVLLDSEHEEGWHELVGRYQKEQSRKSFLFDFIRCLTVLVFEDSKDVISKIHEVDLVEFIKVLQLKVVPNIRKENARLSREIGTMKLLNEQCKQALHQMQQRQEQEEIIMTEQGVVQSEEDYLEKEQRAQTEISHEQASDHFNEAMSAEPVFYPHLKPRNLSKALSRRLITFILSNSTCHLD